MVATIDLESIAKRCGGSSPPSGINSPSNVEVQVLSRAFLG